MKKTGPAGGEFINTSIARIQVDMNQSKSRSVTVGDSHGPLFTSHSYFCQCCPLWNAGYLSSDDSPLFYACRFISQLSCQYTREQRTLTHSSPQTFTFVQLRFCLCTVLNKVLNINCVLPMHEVVINPQWQGFSALERQGTSTLAFLSASGKLVHEQQSEWKTTISLTACRNPCRNHRGK